MAVKIYRSSDTSAPILTGELGTLNALLYACLVIGYGSKTALGWSRAFNDPANDTSVFLNGAGSTGTYLRVDDGAPGAGVAREARAVAYLTMSDVDTGTGNTGNVFIRKSASVDATARSWTLIGSEKVFYLFVYNGDTGGYASVFAFGDCYSYKPSDLYRAVLIGRTTENTSSATSGTDAFAVLTAGIGVTTSAHSIMRSYTGVGSPAALGKHANYFEANQVIIGGVGGVTYPNPVDGGLLLAQVCVHEVDLARGELPGIWAPLHNNALAKGDTLNGVGGLGSKTFEVISIYLLGQCLIETSDTWTEN